MKLSEITLTQIKQNNIKGFPETKKRQKLIHVTGARDIKFTPYIPSNTLLVKSNTTSNGHKYVTSIEFKDVNFNEDSPVSFMGTDGETHSLDPIREQNINVDVVCDCLDFRFRFADFHYQNKSLIGNPPPTYIKKTDRPPVNPKKALGGCKHVLALADKLRQMRIIR